MASAKLNKLTAEQQKMALTIAVDQRSRVYSKIFSIVFRFEHDNTNAENDTKHFQTILKCFGFPRAEEYGSDRSSGGSVEEKFRDVSNAAVSGERALVMVHYAGHVKLDVNRKLAFLASKEARAPGWSITISTHFNTSQHNAVVPC